MARTEYQKLKILYIMKAFLERTDSRHVLSAQDLIDYLRGYDVTAERKSIYRDISLLQMFGFDIVYSKEKSGYFLAGREFELPELKLLVDAVQSSKFITYRKSEELIKKLESLASIYEAKQLQRKVVVSDRIKTMNESIYYNIDYIHNAIIENKKIRFQYFQWTIEKEKELRKGGAYYVISPWELTWDDANYYLLGFDSESERVKHYRVDKMQKMSVCEEQREGRDFFLNFNAAKFAARTFGMFGGETETVTLYCENRFAGIMIDRFGKEVSMRREGDTHFKVRAEVNVSAQFFGWLAGLGQGVKIAAPDRVILMFQEHMEKVLCQYTDFMLK